MLVSLQNLHAEILMLSVTVLEGRAFRRRLGYGMKLSLMGLVPHKKAPESSLDCSTM